MSFVRTAVVPAAGLGTRMRPATEAVPKELLPVGGRPAIDWILSELWISGIERVIVVTSPRKPAIDAYLRSAHVTSGRYNQGVELGPQVEDLLRRELEIEIVHQVEPRGLGDAIRLAHRAAGDESLAVLLPDELMLAGAGLFVSMIDQHAHTGLSVVSLMQVPSREISSYGCADVSGIRPDGSLFIAGCVEKPEQSAARSNYAICGRYILDKGLLDGLEGAKPDARGEVQITPLLDEAAQIGKLTGIEVRPSDGRVDVGSWSGWLAANQCAFDMEFAADEDLGPVLADMAKLA